MRAKGKPARLPYRLFVAHGRSVYARTAVEVGHVTIAWSAVQAALLQMFVILFPKVEADAPIFKGAIDYWRTIDHLNTPHKLPARLWRLLPSDRLQRQLLREIVTTALLHRRYRKLREAIFWSIKRVDDLATHRNDAAHTPLQSIRVSLGSTGRRLGWYITANRPLAARSADRIPYGDLRRHFRAISSDLYQMLLFIEELVAVCYRTNEAPDEQPLVPPRPRQRTTKIVRSGSKGRARRSPA